MSKKKTIKRPSAVKKAANKASLPLDAAPRLLPSSQQSNRSTVEQTRDAVRRVLPNEPTDSRRIIVSLYVERAYANQKLHLRRPRSPPPTSPRLRLGSETASQSVMRPHVDDGPVLTLGVLKEVLRITRRGY
jgi:hypothetical protein